MFYDYVDARQEEPPNGFPEIYFKIDGTAYRMDINEDWNGVYRPVRVAHVTSEICPLCHRLAYYCIFLDKDKMAIFEEIKEHN